MQPDDQLGFELFELLPDAILAVDRHGVIQYANRQAGRLFGQEPETLVSAPVEALIPEHLRERHIAHRAKYAAEPRMRPMGTGLDLVARRADGTTFPVDIMLNPIEIEKQRLVLAVVRDITERKRAETQVQQLMRELRHRVKNILSVVQAMAHQTSANSVQEFVLRFSERIRGLSSSLDLLVKNEWQNVPLAELVRSQLAHFGDLLGNRITVRGMNLRITAAAAQTIGMALHELATNASKYGALSTDTGHVDIVWRLERVGLAVLRRMKPFDVDLHYTDRHRLPPAIEKELGANFHPNVQSLVKLCDIISIHTPLHPETEHLFNDTLISTMKRGAYMVNTARGKICDRDAIVRALENGKLAGYAGDVWFPEPAPKDHPWRTMPHHGMTPHTAGTTLPAQARYAAGVREILECWFEKRPIRQEYLIVEGGKLAGTGAHSYSAGDATGGSEEAERFKNGPRRSAHRAAR